MEKSFCEFLVDIGLIDRKISNNIKFINIKLSYLRFIDDPFNSSHYL